MLKFRKLATRFRARTNLPATDGGGLGTKPTTGLRSNFATCTTIGAPPTAQLPALSAPVA